LQLTGLEIFCQENYPIPVKDGKMLFYFQRSCNTNTIVYELNKLQNGSINNDNPIVEYWILYNKGGARLDLSFIQRTAFGLQSELLDKEKGNFILHFSRYKKRSLYLVNTEGKYKVFIDINGTPAELNKIFIKCENNILGFPTVIHYVEISGKDIKTGNPVSEKIKP
jgi:hypothetical protein